MYMLHLYQSNRLEYLAEMMAHIHAIQPLASPFVAEEIVVQSQGMRRFINQFLANQQGIAANIRFSLPAGLSWRLMREAMPNTPALSPFSPEVMRWRLLQLFVSEQFLYDDAFQAARLTLAPYLENGEYATYQLAGQLADVFDQYLVYRPDWIDAWQKGQCVAGISNEQIWQAQLWRYLDDGQQAVPHRVQLWENLLHYLEHPNFRLPERFFVFGIATLAPMYLALLMRVAKHREVHIFALNPSEEYWGQVIEPAQILQNDGDSDLSQQGHPLLASLGKQGRDFFDALTEMEMAESHVFEPEPTSANLLHQLQYDLQAQIVPDKTNSAWCQDYPNDANRLSHLQNTDRSIQIHSAHSPLRELQILKDQILIWLQDNPEWQPSDIAVLTPHIEPYAPFIEAVFGQQTGDAQALPYSISDVKLSRRQPLLYAIEQTLVLFNSRFEVDKLWVLLESDAVLQRFELTHADLPLLRDTIAQLNIHWGADASQRQHYGDDDNLFTWQQGLERLILGWMLPENNGQLWQNISAWHSRPDHLNILSRFASLVQVLCDLRLLWREPANVATWTERVRHLLLALFAPSDTDRDAVQQLETALAKWLAESELAQFTGTLSQDTAIKHINLFLNSQDDAGFLRGGITFCGMVPMRSLPFKAIALLGLNDGDFPRNTKATSFDLIAKHPKKGDRARRDDDRYLFLEAILSAREILYLSYIGQDIRTNDARAPSTLLNELVDCVAEMVALPSAVLWQEWVVSHPLQPFSRQYFSGSLKFISSRSDYAHAFNQPLLPAQDFFRQPVHVFSPENQIEQNDFIQFWRNPVKHYLRQCLDWRAPYRDEQWEAAEPFSPMQPRVLSDAYLAARRNHQSFDEVVAQLRAQSVLPVGKLGELVGRDYAMQAAALDENLLHSPKLPERSAVLFDVLNVRLNHVYEVGQILDTAQILSEHNAHGKLSGADKIALLLQHLIFCAATDDTVNKQTHFIQLPHVLTLPAIDQTVACEILHQWLTVYQAGQNAPIAFFPRVNWAAAEKLFEKENQLNENGALKEAAQKYHKGYTGFAQEDYPEVKLVYGRNPHAEPPYRSPEFLHLTHNLFAGLSGCLKAFKGELVDEKDED